MLAANIEGVNRILVNGTDALKYSEITTNLTQNSRISKVYVFQMFIYGTNNISYDVYCSSGDICKIGCIDNTSCNVMNLYCYGTCFVNCSYGGCPFLQSGNYTSWSVADITTTGILCLF